MPFGMGRAFADGGGRGVGPSPCAMKLRAPRISLKGFVMKRVSLVFTLALATGLSTQMVNAQTLKMVKDRGMLSCGVSSGLPGFSNPDDKGNWTGLDVDVCRAVAAVIFDDPTKVKFVPLSAKDRFTALQSGEIDMLSRTTTWTLSRDTSLGANFTGVNYYDGQGFMVKKSLKVNSALELNSASVCVATGTTTEQNLADYFKGNNMKYEVIAFATNDETIKAYESGRCDVFTTDVSGLYAERLRLANPADHVVLPEVISKEPLGPMVRHGDDQWFDLVKWVLFAMVDAEELGITQKNVDDMAKSDKPELKRVFGTDGNLGEQLGVSADRIDRLRRWPSRLEIHRRGWSPNCDGRLAGAPAGADLPCRFCSSRRWPGSAMRSSATPGSTLRRNTSRTVSGF